MMKHTHWECHFVRLLKGLKHFSAKTKLLLTKFPQKYTKQSQILWLLRIKENNKSDKSYTVPATGLFSDLVTPDIVFTDGGVVQCNAPVVKIL